MSIPKIVAGALLAGSLVVGGIALAGPVVVKSHFDAIQLASGDDDHDGDEDEYGKAASGEMLDAQTVTRQLSEKGFGEIRKIEREGGRYEVKARDRDGRWRELEVDGRTGEILRNRDDD
ncbi:MAG: PepSY domain-containing protein [Rhodospirillaceae bacterium]|jgi:uncharacterized membrane protein YkoI|nr:PepSY domain-containing protein [Rhodospirillaceae bacterium]